MYVRHFLTVYIISFSFEDIMSQWERLLITEFISKIIILNRGFCQERQLFIMSKDDSSRSTGLRIKAIC